LLLTTSVTATCAFTNSCYDSKRAINHHIKSKPELRGGLQRLKAEQPDKYNLVLKGMRAGKRGERRSASQLQLSLNMIVQVVHSRCASRKKGYVLLCKAEYIPWKCLHNGMTNATAKRQWKKDLQSSEVFSEIEDGVEVVAVKKPTEIDDIEQLSVNKQIDGTAAAFAQRGEKTLQAFGKMGLSSKMMKPIRTSDVFNLKDKKRNGDSSGSESSKQSDVDEEDSESEAGDDDDNDDDSNASSAPTVASQQSKRRKPEKFRRSSPVEKKTKHEGGRQPSPVGRVRKEKKQRRLDDMASVEEHDTPSKFTIAKRSFKRVIETKLETYKLDNMPADACMQKMYEPVKDDSEVQALNIPQIIKNFVDSRKALQNALHDIPAWKFESCNFRSQKSKVENIMKEADANYQCVLDFHKCLVDFYQEHKGKEDLHKRQDRYKKGQEKANMVKCGCPAPLAGLYAAFLDGRGERYQPSASCAYDALRTEDSDFTRAMLYTTKEAGDNALYESFHAEYNVLKAAADGSVARAKRALIKQASTHSRFAIDIEDYKLGFPSAGKSSDSTVRGIEVVGYVRPIVFVQNASAFQSSLENQPLPGTAAFLTVMSGYAQVFLLECKELMEHKFGYESQVHVLEQNFQFMRKATIFGAPAGTTIYIPFGIIPIVVGLESQVVDKKERKKAEEYDILTYVLHYALDVQMARTYDLELRTEVVSTIRKSLAMKGKVLDAPSVEAITKYIEAITEDK
jgi:hypothetical protein